MTRETSLVASMVAATAAFLAASPFAQAAPILDAAGGHYYERIDVQGGLTWSTAKADALALSFMGVQGHLAVITSAAEDTFIKTNFAVFTSVDPGGIGFGPWIGAFCAVGACNQLSAYQWVDGEAFTYNGFGSFEPSGDGLAGTGAGVQYLNFRNGWNDSASGENRPPGFIVEFDVPEPMTLALFGFGAAAVGWLQRRKHA